MNLLTLRTTHATSTISPYGAQVLSFVPTGQPDVLWHTSPELLQKAHSNNKAMRGGIPICWPWFLAHPTEPNAPSHGFARLGEWQLTHQSESPEKSSISFELFLDGTHPAWPYKTRGNVTITLTNSLSVELTTTNLSKQSFQLTQALHTYLSVGHIEEMEITDITNLNRSHVSTSVHLPDHTGPFRITEETEHLVSPIGTLTLHDKMRNRDIIVTNQHSTEFVIWNPWKKKAATLDMPPEDYQKMFCLEAANINDAPTLEPNQSITLSTTISVG